MRYIIRQVGKYDPIFDEDLKGSDCMFFDDPSIRIGYVSHNTDEGDAIVINLRSARDLYVETEKIDNTIKIHSLKKIENSIKI